MGARPSSFKIAGMAYAPRLLQPESEGLVAFHRELEVGYCRLVTIGTDNVTETNQDRSGVGAHWPFLSDVRRIVQKIATSPNTPIPSTIP